MKEKREECKRKCRVIWEILFNELVVCDVGRERDIGKKWQRSLKEEGRDHAVTEKQDKSVSVKCERGRKSSTASASSFIISRSYMRS